MDKKDEKQEWWRVILLILFLTIWLIGFYEVLHNEPKVEILPRTCNPDAGIIMVDTKNNLIYSCAKPNVWTKESGDEFFHKLGL